MRAIVERKEGKPLAFVCLLLACLLSAVFLADELSSAVKSGLELAIGAIVPSLFPFMILADLTAAYTPKDTGSVGRAFEKLLRIDAAALGAFVIGNLSGAPVGAAMLSSLRINGGMSRDEAERAIAISSGPSLAFTVSGVGAAMWGDAILGALLYLSVMLASLIYALTSRGVPPTHINGRTVPKKFELIKSIESATFTSLRVTGVITAFTVLTYLVQRLEFTESASALIIPLLELGGAASYLSECALPNAASLILTAFSLGFSGFSIHLQVRSAIADTDIRYSRFLLAKLIIGVLSAAIFSLILLFIK